jgi:phage antirepressor YoqD-like protein
MVLPSIRQNGGYIANQENMTPEQIVANALIVAQNIIEQKNKQIEEMKPKAEFFDAVADSKTAISMNEVAKVLAIKGYGRNNLFEFLRNEKILDRYNVPYQRYVDLGWFRVIEQKYMKNGEQQVTTKTLVYQKGVDGIRKKIMNQ